jgi:predicted HicB family RNase H-like nuclease
VAKKTIVHKGYHGSIEVDNQDYSLHGKILFIEEESRYRGETFAELEITFQQAVEKHIKKCVTKGETPPFS